MAPNTKMAAAALIFCAVFCVATADICDPDAQTSNDAGPAFPQIPGTFETRMQLNDKLRKVSKEIRYVFDSENMDAAIFVDAGAGARTKSLYKFVWNELFNIGLGQDKTCTLSKITSQDTQISDSDAFHVCPVSFCPRALYSADKFKYKFQGRATPRGIPCLRWSSCVRLGNATLLVEYSWSDAREWLPTSGFNGTAPVRAWVKGEVTDGGSGQEAVEDLTKFELIFDFVDWREGEENIDRNHLLVPTDVYCPRYRKLPMPDMPKSFSFRSELVTPDWDVIGLQIALLAPTDEWYDFDHNLFKIRYKNFPTFSELTALVVDSAVVPSTNGTAAPGSGGNFSETVEIHDYNTGLAYKTDVEKGSCEILTIGESKQRPESEFTTAQTLKLSNPKHFFKYDQAKYSYVGERWERDIYCRVFLGQGNYTFGGKNTKATYEWSLLSDAWVEDIGDKLEVVQPVRLRITPQVENPSADQKFSNFRMDYNMYKFRAEQVDLSDDFDASACFLRQKRQRVTFTFPGKYSGLVSRHLPEFRYAVVAQISKTAKISPLRVVGLQVRHGSDDEDLQVEFNLLDASPAVPASGDGNGVSETSLAIALQNIVKAVEENVFIVDLGIMDDELMSRVAFSAKPNSLKHRILLDGKPEISEKEEDKYSIGELLGVGGGLFAVGFVSALIVTFFVARRRAAQQVE